jgi:hypothetical protein
MKALTEDRLQGALVRFRKADYVEDCAADRAYYAGLYCGAYADTYGTVRNAERALRRANLRCRRAWAVYKTIRDRMRGRR